ncbi:MAG: hypothetical protein RIR11_722 [Bacteroidota bacterium]|jgi:hypothetical protein
MNFDNKKLFVVFYFVFKTFFGFRLGLNARSTSPKYPINCRRERKVTPTSANKQSQFFAQIQISKQNINFLLIQKGKKLVTILQDTRYAIN